MKPSEAAPTEPEMFRKSTNEGMRIATRVTTRMMRTLSVMTLMLWTSFESCFPLKNSRSSMISKAHRI